jgi:hypothetical protein
MEKKEDLPLVGSRLGSDSREHSNLLLTVKGVNSPKMELFDVVARLEPGLMEFGHALDAHSAYP